MRDLRLSFWSSVYGGTGLILVLLSRLLSVWLTTHPVRTVCFPDPLNYLLILASLLLFLRATALASISIKKMRSGKKELMVIQILLILDLLFFLSAQVLHFTLEIDITQNVFVGILTTLTSLPSVCGLYALYFSKQLRSKMQYFALGLFIAAIVWNLLRLTDKILIPCLLNAGAENSRILSMIQVIAGLNDELSFILFSVALIGIGIYAYYSGSAVKRMPDNTEY